jgi:hypothetical protein
MIRIGVNRIYGMNDTTTFTEEDFRNALELNKELAKNSLEKNQKLISELDRIEAEAVCLQSLNQCEHRPVYEPPKATISKQEPAKKPFHNYGLFFRSETSPSVYKLSGDLSTFDEQDIEFNNCFPQRVVTDFLEQQRKQYIDELSNKDLLKAPFVQKKEKSKDELVGKMDFDPVEVVPKPPPKWRKFTDKEGDTYYFNVVSKVTQWDKPEEFEE